MGLLKPWSGAKYVTLVTPLLLNTDSMGLLDGTLNAGFSLQSKAIQVNTSKTDFWFKQKWMYTKKKASTEVVYFCNTDWGLFFSLRHYSGCGLPVLPNWNVILDPQWHGKKTWIFLFHSVDYMDWSWGDTGRGEKSSDDLTERHSKFLHCLYFFFCLYVLCAGEDGIALTLWVPACVLGLWCCVSLIAGVHVMKIMTEQTRTGWTGCSRDWVNLSWAG